MLKRLFRKRRSRRAIERKNAQIRSCWSWSNENWNVYDNPIFLMGERFNQKVGAERKRQPFILVDKAQGR